MPNDVPRELGAFAEHQDGNANHSPVDEDIGYDEGGSNIKSVCVYSDGRNRVKTIEVLDSLNYLITRLFYKTIELSKNYRTIEN